MLSPVFNSRVFNSAVFRQMPRNGGFVSTRSLSFNGTNGQYLSVPDNSAFDHGTGAFTVSFWLKTSNFVQLLAAILAKEDWNSGATGHLFYTSSNTATLYYWGNSGIRIGNVADGTWKHIAVVRNSSQQTVAYLNGVSVGTSADPRSLSNSFPFTIGCDQDGNRAAAFKMDDVRIWSRALSSSEVAAILANESPTDMAVHFEFEEGSGTSTTDSVGGLVGTLNGGVAWSTDVPAALAG